MCALAWNLGDVEPGEKIALARNAKRPRAWSQYDVAHLLAERGSLGLDATRWRSRLANYENRGGVPANALAEIAQILSVDLGWLSDRSDGPVKWAVMAPNAKPTELEEGPQLNIVPFWGTVPCGNWEKPFVDDESYIEISESVKDIRSVVCVKVAGNSMMPRFQHGEKVAVRLSSTPIDGVVTLARNQDGELTLKLMVYARGEWELHSLNPDYGCASAESWEILGHAIHREETDTSGLRA